MVYILIFISIFLGVAGQTLIKHGVTQVGGVSMAHIVPFFVSAFTNISVLGGLFLYVVSTLLWLVILSKVNLSFAYPMLSLGYIFILLSSWLFLHETISSLQFVGVLLIIFGVVCIFRG